jgi:hypothetical protein
MAGGVGLFLRVYRWTAGIQALPIMETEFFSPPSFVPLFSTPVRLGSDWRENSEGPVRPVEPGATVCLFVKRLNAVTQVSPSWEANESLDPESVLWFNTHVTVVTHWMETPAVSARHLVHGLVQFQLVQLLTALIRELLPTVNAHSQPPLLALRSPIPASVDSLLREH